MKTGKNLYQLMGMVVALSLVISGLVGCGKAAAPTPAATPTPVATPTPTPAKEWTLKFATHMPPTYPIVIEQTETFKAIEARTNRQVRIAIYHSEQLVKASALLDSVKTGVADIVSLNDAMFSGTIPILSWSMVPYLFGGGTNQVISALNAGIYDLLAEELNKHNGVVIGWLFFGPDHIGSNKTMPKRPSDIAGQKIRVYDAVHGKLVEQSGGSPTTLASGELYLALQRGTIDGLIASISTFSGRKLQEVCKNYATGVMSYTGQSLVVNKDTWNTLPKDIQNIFIEEARKAAERTVKRSEDDDAAGLKAMQQQGVQVYKQTPDDIALWKQASKPAVEWWIGNAGPGGKKIAEIAEKTAPR